MTGLDFAPDSVREQGPPCGFCVGEGQAPAVGRRDGGGDGSCIPAGVAQGAA